MHQHTRPSSSLVVFLAGAVLSLCDVGSALAHAAVIAGGGTVSGGGVTVSVNNITGGLYSTRGGGGVYPAIRVGYPYYYRYPTYQGPPLWEIARRLDPQLVGAVTPTPVVEPPQDTAGQALLAHDYRRAVGLFAQRVAVLESGLDDPAVPGATLGAQLRLLALAMLGAGMPEDASDVMLRAYHTQPSLADAPLDPTALLGSAGELRSLLGQAMSYAGRSSAAEPWFLIGVLHQAEGKNDQARADIEKARELGAAVPQRDDAWRAVPVQPVAPMPVPSATPSSSGAGDAEPQAVEDGEPSATDPMNSEP